MKRLLVLCFAILVSIACHGARKALVVGNTFYGINCLASPANDALLLSQTLAELGFEMIEKLDTDYEAFDTGLKSFSESIGPEDEVFFYFGGIALQMESENYLLPIGFNYKSVNDIRYFSIPLRRVVDDLSKAKYAMMFVDGGRDNTYITVTGGQTGLAVYNELPRNVILQYSTAPDQWLASDILPISTYAQALNTQLRSPVQDMTAICTNTSEQVKLATDDLQIPWWAGTLPEYYYINQGSIDEKTDPPDAETIPAVLNYRDLPADPKIVSIPVPGQENAPQIYYGNDAPQLHKPGKFARMIDLVSASEYISNESKDFYSSAHFASWNRLRFNLALFGAEAYIKKIIARYSLFASSSGRVETNITEYGFGAGLPDPEKLRLFATMNMYDYDLNYPDAGVDFSLKDHYNFTFSFAKRVSSNQQTLQLGGDYTINSSTYPTDFINRGYMIRPYSFDHRDYSFFPSWQARGYIYATDIPQPAYESLYLSGIAPRDRPLLFLRNDGLLMGISLDVDNRRREVADTTEVRAYRFSSLLHKNFGKALGFDFNFDYNDYHDLINDIQTSFTSLRATMRLTLIDTGPLAFSTAMDYTNTGYLAPDLESQSDPMYDRHHGLNGAASLAVDVSGILFVSVLGQMNGNWQVDESIFNVSMSDYFLGGTLGLKY